MSNCNRAGVGRVVRIPMLGMMCGLSAWLLAVNPSVKGQEAGGVGKLESPTGTLLRRGGSDKEWKAVAKDAAVPDRDLLLALPRVRAVISTGKGAIRLTLAGNVPQQSPIPSLESAVTLRQSGDFDLDVILDRG